MPYIHDREPNRIVTLLRRYRHALLENLGPIESSARLDFVAGLQVYQFIFDQVTLSQHELEEVYQEVADGLVPIHGENFLSIASTLKKSFAQVSHYLRTYPHFLHLLRLIANSASIHPQWLKLIPQNIHEQDWALAGELNKAEEQFKVVWKICRFAHSTSGHPIPRGAAGAIEELKRSIVPPPRPHPRDLANTFASAEDYQDYLNIPRLPSPASSVSSLD